MTSALPDLTTVPEGCYRLGHVVRSEWTKFVSLRSCRWTLAAFPLIAMALGVAIAAVSGAGWSRMSPADRAHWDPTNNVLAGLIPGYLVIPVLGVVMMSSEHSYGTIRSTFAAVPRRPLVLAAKVTVFATVTFGVCELVTFATFFAGQRAMGGAPHATVGQPGVLRALVLSGAFLVLMGLFGLGLGAVIRHTGAAVATYAAVAVVVPPILHAFPGNLARFGPIIILGNSVAAARVEPEFLSPWAGFAAMALYAAVALAAGLVLLVRRDA